MSLENEHSFQEPEAWEPERKKLARIVSGKILETRNFDPVKVPASYAEILRNFEIELCTVRPIYGHQEGARPLGNRTQDIITNDGIQLFVELMSQPDWSYDLKIFHIIGVRPKN